MTDHGAVMEGLADAGLESAFGAEYLDLDDHARRLIIQDILDASQEERTLSIREYARRIGAGNLKSYAECQKAQERRAR